MMFLHSAESQYYLQRTTTCGVTVWGLGNCILLDRDGKCNLNFFENKGD